MLGGLMSEQELFIGAITSLVGAVIYLYKTQSSNFSNALEKLDQCEQKHEVANKKIIELAEKVGKLAGYQELHDNVIHVIKSSQSNNL